MATNAVNEFEKCPQSNYQKTVKKGNIGVILINEPLVSSIEFCRIFVTCKGITLPPSSSPVKNTD